MNSAMNSKGLTWGGGVEDNGAISHPNFTLAYKAFNLTCWGYLCLKE